MLRNKLYQDLRTEIDGMDIISTHEHNIIPQEVPTLGYIFRNSYIRGCGVKPGDTSEERAEFLDTVQVNSYYRWLLVALQDLYDFDGEITPGNWDEISRRIASAHKKPDWYFEIMQKHGNIKRAILDAYWHPGHDNNHPEFYSSTFRINAFIMSYAPSATDHNGNSGLEVLAKHGMEVNSFEDYLDGLKKLLHLKKNQGCVAVKSALAYDRSLDFEPVSRDAAAAVFTKQGQNVDPLEAKLFGDYVFYFIAKEAGKLALPLQCHVGLGKIQGSNPMHLIPVIENCPETKFVLMHGGYPWYHEIAGLLHNYHNVYADLVWLPLISPTAAVNALHEWIEVALSQTKISWGGDAWTPEEVYGGVLSIRHVLARVLAEKIDEGYMSKEIALRLAGRILKDNAIGLYGLKES
ncbi:MAG: amidohydrolase family protein [Firmicutes bacterium]|nr:amidohydrolase family protein [Bacillota bacterium]